MSVFPPVTTTLPYRPWDKMWKVSKSEFLVLKETPKIQEQKLKRNTNTQASYQTHSLTTLHCWIWKSDNEWIPGVILLPNFAIYVYFGHTQFASTSFIYFWFPALGDISWYPPRVVYENVLYSAATGQTSWTQQINENEKHIKSVLRCFLIEATSLMIHSSILNVWESHLYPFSHVKFT